MLGVTQYNPGRYPPPGFPAFSAASAATPAFNRLQGMIDRKKGSNEILQQRAAQYQSGSTPALTGAQPAPTPMPALTAPMQARPALSIASSHNIFTDAESGDESAETESDGPASPPRRDLMRLASGAMASGKQVVSAVAPMAYDGLSYATAKSQQALNAGVDYGVQMARSAGSLAPPLYHGAMRGAQAYGGHLMNAAVEHGVPAMSMLGNGGVSATLAVGNGVGSVLSGLGNAAVEHGAPAGRMIANGLGSATVALGNGVGQSLTGLANVAAEHGPPLAKAAMDGLAYQGSKAFHALYDAIKRLPATPSLEMPEYEGGNAMVSYQPIRNRRSNSPGRSPRAQQTHQPLHQRPDINMARKPRCLIRMTSGWRMHPVEQFWASSSSSGLNSDQQLLASRRRPSG